MKILVAEDNTQSLYLLEQYFAGHGHEVWAAVDGRAALALCHERGAPDIIVSDALMPLLDGFELCDAVRRSPDLAHLPFILYTATYTAESDERFAASIGVDRFVVKPIEPDQLLAIVAEVHAAVHRTPPRAPLPAAPNAELLQEYARLVSVKLEDKLAELSRTNAALQASEDSVRQLNERLLVTVHRLEREVEQRRRTAELLRLAQQVGGIGSWECDADGKLCWSEEAVQLLGLTMDNPADLPGAFFRSVAPEDRTRVEALLLGHPDTAVNEVELRFGSAPAPRHLLLRGGRHQTSGDRRPRRLGIVQEVTARKEAEVRRQSLEQQLYSSQKMEALGNLAGGIAHDFNNILTAILFHAELLQLELPGHGLPPEVESSPAGITEAADRAREIISQILTFSRRQPVERKPLPFAKVVEGAVRLVRSTVSKTVEVRCQLGSNRLVSANEGQLHQVLLNLCTNAAQAMRPNGGVITVTLADVDVSAAEAARNPGLLAGPHLRLEVSDTGAGIAPAIMDHIFEPFFTTKPAGEGTGLGLAVVHGIVQSHEATISVESRAGRGTTFTLLFPASTGQPALSAVPPAGPLTPAGRGQRVLVVDDEPGVARNCAQLLERLGYAPTAITDPTEARELFQREPQAFALAVVDFLMPRLTGPDLARAFWSKQPKLPVILVAGFGTQMDASKARAEGFCDFLAKPFTLAKLGEALARALP